MNTKTKKNLGMMMLCPIFWPLLPLLLPLVLLAEALERDVEQPLDDDRG